MNNISCRIFKEQIELLKSLPSQEEAMAVLYQSVINAYNQFENQNKNQNDFQSVNQNENIYISISLSLLSKNILNLLSKNIVFKEYSSNCGGKRLGSGRPKKNPESVITNDSKCYEKITNDNKSKRFIKPTVEEIKLYCQERKNTVNADKFFDFYESKGWKVGNQPMKDWKAAVRTWERSATQKSSLYDKCVENGLKFLEGFDD